MKYTGGCHCGKVRYEVELDIKEVTACNCSICGKRGALLAFAPESSFKLLSGEAEISHYSFGKKRIDHSFCSVCGVGSFGSGAMPDGTKIKSINVRCLDDVDPLKFPVRHFDGKNL